MNETSSLWPHFGAILTGGCLPAENASRAGRPLWDEPTMLKHLLTTMLHVCRAVVVVGQSELAAGLESERVRLIPCENAGSDPLTGLETLFASGLDSGYLVAGCDQPFLTTQLLRQLLDGQQTMPHLFLAPKGTSFYPFPAYYPASLLTAVKETRASQNPSLKELLSRKSTLYISISEREETHLLQVNAVAHLEKLQHLTGHNNISI